jgi:hypothetical protein
MSVSAVSSATQAVALHELQKSASAQPTSKSAQPSRPTDTVSLSPAALKASPAGDVDHDGDSH